MKYTTIFFDLDDTLVDTALNCKEVLIDIYTDLKLNNHYETFDEFYNRYSSINSDLWDLYAQNKISKKTLRTERFLRALKGSIDLTPLQSLELNDSFLERVKAKKNVIGGAKEILDYLKPKYRLYILSNGFEEVQDKKMENAQLDSYFKKVILSDHIGINKPHPKIFAHALSEACASSNDSIMIGDNIATDIVGAKNSNIDQVWYNPLSLPDKDGIEPTFTIRNLDELRKFL